MSRTPRIEDDAGDLVAAVLVLTVVLILAVSSYIALQWIDASKSDDVAEVAGGAVPP
jgi:hypothetical protein